MAVASNSFSDVAGLDGIAVSLNTTGRSALSRVVILNEGCRHGMAEGVPCLGYHVLSHEKSQVH